MAHDTSRNSTILALAEQLRDGGIARRDFLKKAAALGISVAASKAMAKNVLAGAPRKATRGAAVPIPPGVLSTANDFRIGMFGCEYKPDPQNWCKVANQLKDGTGGTYNTSQLNVMAEDGFNTAFDYNANWSDSYMDSILNLVNLNSMQMLVESKAFYRPSTPDPGNDYNGGQGPGVIGQPPPNLECVYKARPNYASLIANVYSKNNRKNAVWGHQITEEASYNHFYNPTVSTPLPYPQGYVAVEIPTTKVDEAISYFRTALLGANIGNQKLIAMEANHHKSIHDGTNIHDISFPGPYNPQDYINGNLHMRSDIFFEGSYTFFPTSSGRLGEPYSNIPSGSGWLGEPYSNIKLNGPGDNWHYLGPFKSIDYALDHAPEVHKVIQSYLFDSSDPAKPYLNVYHSDASVPNADWLWCQAYLSIVHRATGTWFWSLDATWLENEKPNNNTWIAMPDRYERCHFPSAYQSFVGPLANQLRYLVKNNLLSSDFSTIVATKRDHPDDFCVVPPAATYIDATAVSYGGVKVFDPPNPPVYLDEHKSENYGIRYTIRTDGNNVIMIAVNPIPVWLDIQFTFDGLSNVIIANSTAVDALFETAADQIDLNAKSDSYKTERIFRADWSANSATSRSINYLQGQKSFIDRFGPLDVHIYKFRNGGTSTPKPCWNHIALNWDAPAIADSDLVVNAAATNVFYRGSDNLIYNFWWDTRGWWRHDALGFNAPWPAAGSLTLDNQGTHLFFRGADNAVYNYWWDGSKWQAGRLSPASGGNCAGKLVLNPAGDHVFYIGNNGTVYNFWWDGSTWQFGALDPNSKIAASDLVYDAYNTRLFFRSINNAVYSLSWIANTYTWQLDALDPTAPRDCAGNLQINSAGDHVFYITVNNEVCNFWRNNGKWEYGLLDPNATKIAASNLLYDPIGNKLFFLGIDNRVYNFWWNTKISGANKWHQDSLDWNAPMNCVGNLVLGPASDHVFYSGIDGLLYNFWWTGAKWRCDVVDACQPPAGVHDIIIDKSGRLFCLAGGRVFTYYWATS